MSEITFSGAGDLEVFLARSEEEIKASQNLRYRVFCEEMGADASDEMKKQQRDFDEFDEICDHMLVRDTMTGKIVGSYRLLRRSNLPKGRKFYSSSEYDLSKTLKYFDGEIMELGRSCVDEDYRTRSTMQILWKAIANYSTHFNVELMFGCASFPGSDHRKHAKGLSYLYHNHLAPKEFRPRAIEELYSPMDLMPKHAINFKEALGELPPLIKGYIRLGCFFGDGAFEDKNYNTTDVCILLRTELMAQKYIDHYSRQETT